MIQLSDEEEEQQQFPNKGLWRAKGCLLIIQGGVVTSSVCTTYYATCGDSEKKVKQCTVGCRLSKLSKLSK